jgi:hypothetical protein
MQTASTSIVPASTVGAPFVRAVAAAVPLLIGAAVGHAAEGAPPLPAEPLALRFALNAFLVPALDADADALPRWVDPRPVARCGPATDVRVDGGPLAAGAAVPATAFVVAWRADACRPFGAAGPAYSGDVRVTVFHDEHGVSAVVEPAGLRELHAGGGFVLRENFGATMPAAQPPVVGDDLGALAGRVAE